MVQEYSEEESMSDTEVEPEPSSKLRDLLCTGQITAKERVHNLCTEYPATVNRMLESETGILGDFFLIHLFAIHSGIRKNIIYTERKNKIEPT